MEGISKERLESHLKRISLQFDQDPNDQMVRMLKQLIMDCTELNPPLPIDEKTPKDKRILLFYPERSENMLFPMKPMTIAGEWDGDIIKGWRCDLYLLWMQRKSKTVQPTHWQELLSQPNDD